MSDSTNKNDILSTIMGSLSAGEETVLSKSAAATSGTNQVTKTEDLKYPAQKSDKPTCTEKKLGLAGLPVNGGKGSTEDLNNPGDATGGGLSGGATENLQVKKMPTESPTYLTKRAAIYNHLNEATGLALEKVAGDMNEQDFLLKQASEILGVEAGELEKTAVALADAMFDRFTERLKGI